MFIEKFSIQEVRLDLGALGHERPKPTTLGTNIRYLHRLEGLSDRRRPGDLHWVSGNLGQRAAASRSWAAWPEAFKIEIIKGILLQLEGYKSMQEGVDQPPMAAKMTSEQWQQHDERPPAVFPRVRYMPSREWQEPASQESSASRCQHVECGSLWTFQAWSRQDG